MLLLKLKINQNITILNYSLGIILFEIAFWLPYFLTLPHNIKSSFGIAVYVISPVVVLLGILLCFITCKKLGTLFCYDDKIIIKKRKKESIIMVNNNLRIKFNRWWQFPNIMLGPGQVVFQENENDPISIYLSKKGFNKIKNLYEKRVNFIN